jgi:hypothetical protein
MKNNVIGMESAKCEIELKRSEAKFKNYLGALKQEELQVEANFIMNSMGQDLDVESLRKSALLMEELAKRVSVDSMSSSISDFANNLRDQLSTKTNNLH